MKSASLIFYILLILGLRTNAQVYVFRDGNVSFFSEAPLENIDAHSKSFNSILNTATNEIVFLVPINSFQFKKSLMQEHFNEKYLESDKFPMATYKGKINEKIDWTKDGTYTITSKGFLTIHGIARERSDTARISITGDKITITGNFLMTVADHKITIPKIVFQNIAEVVSVKFSGEYHPNKSSP